MLMRKDALTVIFTVFFGQHSDLDPGTAAQVILPLARVGVANVTFHVHIDQIDVLFSFLNTTCMLMACRRGIFHSPFEVFNCPGLTTLSTTHTASGGELPFDEGHKKP
jgi:hypothetical protein